MEGSGQENHLAEIESPEEPAVFSLRTILSIAIDACRRRTTETQGYALAAEIFCSTMRYHHLRGDEDIDETKTVARLGCDTDFAGD